VTVRDREDCDDENMGRFLAEHGSLRVARLGALERPLDHPALLAENENGRLSTRCASTSAAASG
jgi:hypothetical protein